MTTYTKDRLLALAPTVRDQCRAIYCANCGRDHPDTHTENECRWFRIGLELESTRPRVVLRHYCSERCLAQHPEGAW